MCHNHPYRILVVYIKSMRESINKHHFCYTRRLYNDPISRELRNHRGMAWNTDKGLHSELHARIPAVKPPDRPIIAHINDNLKDYTSPRSTVLQVIYILDKLSDSKNLSQQRIDSCMRFADFLYKQYLFLTEGI